MNYKKTVKIKIAIGLCYVIAGLIIACFGFSLNSDFCRMFGIAFSVIGIAKATQYFRLLKNEKALHKHFTRINDERNIAIALKARNLAVVIFYVCAAFLCVVLNLTGNGEAAEVAAYLICAFVFINCICYIVMMKMG